MNVRGKGKTMLVGPAYRPMLWLQARNISAFEIVQACLVTWWTVSIYQLHGMHPQRSVVYIRMTHVVPYWAWMAAGVAIVACIVLAALTGRVRFLYLSLFGKVVYWTAITTIVYQAAHTFLTPSAFAVLAIGSIIRYAEVRTRER